jgi:hypothetical protein
MALVMALVVLMTQISGTPYLREILSAVGVKSYED